MFIRKFLMGPFPETIFNFFTQFDSRENIYKIEKEHVGIY